MCLRELGISASVSGLRLAMARVLQAGLPGILQVRNAMAVVASLFDNGIWEEGIRWRRLGAIFPDLRGDGWLVG
jgi:hypothetical protein